MEVVNEGSSNIVRPFYDTARLCYLQENNSQMQQIDTIFDERAIKTAAAIVRIFETGSPVGNYSEVAVLNDGAGISYGVSQFTHRSGSLEAVIDRYLANGGVVGLRVFAERLPLIASRSNAAIRLLAADRIFRRALSAAGITAEMRSAQDAIAFERYMVPAINACVGSGFALPLSLAVIYDAMTHGSYNKIRDRVNVAASAVSGLDLEKRWITDFVRRRDAWLASIPRLRATRYRTRFFMDHLMTGRWQLELPLNVNGIVITEKLLGISPPTYGDIETTVGPNSDKTQTNAHTPPQTSAGDPANDPQARPSIIDIVSARSEGTSEGLSPKGLDGIEARINAAAARYDQVERMTLTVADRTDRAKSLWTTIVGTIWQTAWAVFGSLAGLQREVWFAVALIAAVLTLVYLYRQIALGKIREATNAALLDRPFAR